MKSSSKVTKSPARKSVTRSAPSIIPRGNKSSELRINPSAMSTPGRGKSSKSPPKAPVYIPPPQQEEEDAYDYSEEEDYPTDLKDRNNLMAAIGQSSSGQGLRSGLDVVVVAAREDEVLDDQEEAGAVENIPLIPYDRPPPAQIAEEIRDPNEPTHWYGVRFMTANQQLCFERYREALRKMLTRGGDLSIHWKGILGALADIKLPKTNKLLENVKEMIDKYCECKLHSAMIELGLLCLNTPWGVEFYYMAFRSMKGRVSGVEEQVNLLDTRLLDANVSLKKMGDQIAHTNREAYQAASQFTTISKQLADFAAAIEGIDLKIKRLDLLPSPQEVREPAISLPSSARSERGMMVETINLQDPGHYKGLYEVEIAGGRVVSVMPPEGYRELTGLIDLTLPFQKRFLNADQNILLDKLGQDRTLRLALAPSGTPQRAEMGKKLISGVPKANFQWQKML